MPNPDAIVSSDIQFDPPLDRSAAEQVGADGGVTVVLDGERRVAIDPQDPRSIAFVEILDGLRAAHRPVYLEIDPTSSVITRLAIPIIGRVIGVGADEHGTLAIELDASHAVHRLRLAGPDATDLEARLREALDRRRPVLVVDDDAHEILDVRDYTPGPDDGPLPPFPRPRPWPSLPWLIRPWLQRIWWWPYWPWRWFDTVSQKHAQWLFDTMKATNCAPLTAAAPCIPFMYPDNGCWARANEMCRLMSNVGDASRKVWITHGSGWLHAKTRNHPQCYIEWSWHVAPTILVRGPWFFLVRRMVIDPSLATGPLTESSWKSLMQDTTATLVGTAASQYWPSGGTDPTYAQTNADLQTHRLLLKTRSVQIGPPPYANCP